MSSFRIIDSSQVYPTSTTVAAKEGFIGVKVLGVDSYSVIMCSITKLGTSIFYFALIHYRINGHR